MCGITDKKNLNEFINHSKPYIDEKDIESVKTVLKKGMIAEGSLTNEFEKNFKNYIGTKYSLATTTGTLALFLALKSLNVCANDNIICPSYVCSSVLDAIFQTGGKPNLVDIENNFLISYDSVKKNINDKTKAIIIPHLFGKSADVERFKNFNIPIIEDCAQNIGGFYPNQSKKVGTLGDLSIFSFHATKLMTSGEGGIVTTNSDILYKKIKKLKFGMPEKYFYKYYFAFSDLNASLGLSQLNKMDFFIEKRKKIANMYTENLKQCSYLKLPEQKDNIFFRYPLRLKINGKIDSVISYFLKQGIKINRPVDSLLHKLLNINGDFKVTENVFDSTFSIPLYPALDDAAIKRIINAFNKLEEVLKE